MRHTSIEVYNQIKREGLLEKFRWKVYETVFHNGPMTQNECWRAIVKENGPTNKPSVTPQFAPLTRMGVIHEIGERNCNVSGRNCLIYDVTNRLPQKIEKKKTKDQIIKELRAEIDQLKRELNAPASSGKYKQIKFDLA
jgi:hypothetical protein